MPVKIREENDCLHLTFSVVVTVAELHEAGAATWALERDRPVVPPRITDLTEVTDLDLDFNAVLRLAEDRKSRPFPNSFKSAIVAPKDHLLGFARMFQTLNDHPQITIRIFRDLPSARAWIGEK